MKTTGRRLFDYALLYKKMIVAALLMLTVAVVADLSGPFIAKHLIDNHVLGIESSWIQTDSGKDTVEYKGHFYKREDYLEGNETKLESARILQVNRNFVFIEGDIEFDGERSFHDGMLTITSGEKTATYDALVLSGAELLQFYMPEVPRMLKLLAFFLDCLS